MLDIFEYKDGITYPTIEVLTHPILKKLHDRDTDEHKSQAILEYSYLNFVCSYKKSNPFHEFSDIMDRKKRIVISMFKNESKNEKIRIFKYYTTDIDILECEMFLNKLYEECIPTLRFYKDALIAVDKLSTFIKDINFTETTKTGGLKYTPKSVTDIILEMKHINSVLAELKDLVSTEIITASKTVKNRQISFFEESENADL